MKLLIIANRLPISIKRLKPLDLQRSPGGLVSGLESFLKKIGHIFLALDRLVRIRPQEKGRTRNKGPTSARIQLFASLRPRKTHG